MDSVDYHSNALASSLGIWTFQMVQEKLVEAMRIWWRTPGKIGPGKGSPFASDIPAEMMVKETRAGDYDILGIDRSANDAPIRSAAMTRADVARRDVASEWMAMVPERDKKLVSMALAQLASGRAQISWKALRGPLGVEIGAGGLQRRYERSLKTIANRLNGY